MHEAALERDSAPNEPQIWVPISRYTKGVRQSSLSCEVDSVVCSIGVGDIFDSNCVFPGFPQIFLETQVYYIPPGTVVPIF